MTKLEDFRQKYWGSQDEAFENRRQKGIPPLLVPTPKTQITIPLSDCTRETKKSTRIRVNLPSNDDQPVYYQNLRTDIPEDLIETIELEVGGQRFDRIYGDIIPALRTIYNISDDTIPIYSMGVLATPQLRYHITAIYITLKSPPPSDTEYQMTVDIFPNYSEPEYEREIYTCDFSGPGDIPGVDRLYFNHPAVGLIISLREAVNEPLKEATLEFDGDKVVFPVTKLSERLYYLNLGNGINMSRINKVILRIPADVIFDTYQISRHLQRFMEGMGGLAFSK